VNTLKVSGDIKKVEADGWRLVRTSGSHRHFTHPEKPGIVTISGNSHAEMPKGTLSNVLKQAGLK
jgi:predicted RNA binding protein YcfA (HicA-like mRNA interferase family)